MKFKMIGVRIHFFYYISSFYFFSKTELFFLYNTYVLPLTIGVRIHFGKGNFGINRFLFEFQVIFKNY